MTRTRFCDSSGLHTLIAAHKRANAEGGEVLLVIPGPPVLRVFALTGIDKGNPQLPRPAEALAQPVGTANGRSRQQPKEMFTRALADAVHEYGEGDQACRAAYAEFKRTFEKRGDH